MGNTEWSRIANLHYRRISPYDTFERWNVVQRPDGWYWYAEDGHDNWRPYANAYGPFVSSEEAKADCEAAWKESHGCS